MRFSKFVYGSHSKVIQENSESLNPRCLVTEAVFKDKVDKIEVRLHVTRERAFM